MVGGEMKLELQADLYRKYPLFFRRPRRIAESKYPLDHWGLECGSGWYLLLDDVASHFELYIADLEARGVRKAAWPRPKQIKEKFGTLHVYLRNSRDLPDYLRDAVNRAEHASATTCECCGQLGSLRTMGGVHVYCDACEATKDTELPYDENWMEQLRKLLASRSF